MSNIGTVICPTVSLTVQGSVDLLPTVEAENSKIEAEEGATSVAWGFTFHNPNAIPIRLTGWEAVPSNSNVLGEIRTPDDATVPAKGLKTLYVEADLEETIPFDANGQAFVGLDVSVEATTVDG